MLLSHCFNVVCGTFPIHVALSSGTLYLTLLQSGQKLCPWIRHNGPPLALGVCFLVRGTWDSVNLAH